MKTKTTLYLASIAILCYVGIGCSNAPKYDSGFYTWESGVTTLDIDSFVYVLNEKKSADSKTSDFYSLYVFSEQEEKVFDDFISSKGSNLLQASGGILGIMNVELTGDEAKIWLDNSSNNIAIYRRQLGTQIRKIGEAFGGGIVFDVSAGGLHGLIAETIDQGECAWYEASYIVENGQHSEAGKAFTDWRLPNLEELNKLWNQEAIVGSFAESMYWSSSMDNEYYPRTLGLAGEPYEERKACAQIFSKNHPDVNGMQGVNDKEENCKVRAVRDF